MLIYFFLILSIFPQKYEKFNFYNMNAQDLQKAWIFNFACEENVVGGRCMSDFSVI